MKHTQGEVELDLSGRMLQSVDDDENDGSSIAEFYGPQAEANAAYAKTTWNRHQHLVDTLEWLLKDRLLSDEGRCLYCNVLAVGYGKKAHLSHCKVESIRRLLVEIKAESEGRP